MATFNKVNGFVEHVSEGVHNLGSDQLAIALSNTAPSGESNDPSVATADCILANVTEIAYTNLSGDRNLTTSSSGQSSGTYTLVIADKTITASGGALPEFRYIYIYNDTPTNPADPIIGYYDYGSGLTLADGESLTIDLSAANGLLQIA